MKEAGAQAVKLEGASGSPQIEASRRGGIPVMAHIGFTPQSVNTLGGFRVQGRGDEGTASRAIAVAEAGAFAVVMEMVPADRRADHRQAHHPDRRHRGRSRLRRPGAGLAGHGRPEQRHGRPASSSIRQQRGRIRHAQRNAPKKWPAGFSRPRSTAFR